METSIDYLRGYTDDPTPPARSPAFPIRRPILRIPASARVAALIAEGGIRPDSNDERRDMQEDASSEDDADDRWEEDPPPPLPVGFLLGRLSRASPFTSTAQDRRFRRVTRAPLQVYESSDGAGVRLADGLATRTLPRPPSVHVISDAYAVRWPDNDLAPRVQAGEILVIGPGLYPRQGYDVLAIERGGNGGPSIAACASRFAGACHEHVVIDPYDGRPPVQLKLADLTAFHVIVAILIR